MKRTPVVFLQSVIVLIAILALVLLIVFPLKEGRATGLDLWHIYADKLILFGYAASTFFFAALYHAFRLLGLVGRNRVFSSQAVKALHRIKQCGVILAVLIIIAGIYIRLFHAKEDDPAGFLMLCFLTSFVAIVVATAAAVFEKILQNAVEMKSENDLTI